MIQPTETADASVEGPAYAQTPDTALCGRIGGAEAAIVVLETQGWRARPDSPLIPLPRTQADWEADPLEDRNWRFRLHSWRPLGPYIVAYHRLGDPSLFHKAVALAMSWREAEARTELKDLFWNDMGSGIRAAKLGYLLSRAHEIADLSQAQRDALEALADQHVAKLSDPGFLGESNHAFFQIHGLMALIRARPNHPRASEHQAYLHQALEALLEQQFGREGVHLEHSPGYHLFATRTLRRMLASGWYADMPFARRVLKRADQIFPWLVFPDGLMSVAGDSERGGRTYAYKLDPKKPAKLFREAGYAIVRGESLEPERRAMLFVCGGHHSNVHKHADDLSFELYDHGRPWIVDTGKFSYSQLKWREFTDSARAHNTLAYSPKFPGNASKRTPPAGGMLTALERRGDAWFVSGRVERPVIAAVHERDFLYRPGVDLVIEDRLEMSQPADTWAWLHLAPDLEAEPDGDGWRLPGMRISYAVEGSEMSTARIRGQYEPEYQGWMAERYHKLTPNDALGVRLSGTAVRLITTIAFT